MLEGSSHEREQHSATREPDADPDSPIADFADLFVVGDLFEVGPALLTELRSRPG